MTIRKFKNALLRALKPLQKHGREALVALLIFAIPLQSAVAAGFQYTGIRHDIFTQGTSGGTTTLTSASKQVQQFTGTMAHTVVLPNATTLTPGYWYILSNDSTGDLSVNANGGANLAILKEGQSAVAYLVTNGSAAGTWDMQVGGGSASPLTQKGGLVTNDGLDDVELPPAENGQGLVVDSTSTVGLKYQSLARRNNWLANESFEYTTPDSSWTVSGTWTTDTDAEDKVHGAQSLKMPSGAASISQSITPPAALTGQSIQQTVWVKTTDPGVQVCSLRAGATHECTYAPADGYWHEVGFTYRDPGTGTRGISVSRASGTADTYVDLAYVGAYEPNVPAVINVGGTFKGGIIHPSTASCSWDRSTTSISWGDFSAVSACPVPTGSNLLGEGLAPSTKKPSIRFNDLPAGSYQVIVNGWVISSTGRPCHFRVSDGTSASNAVPSVSTVPNSSSNFYLNRTSSGAAEITVQSTADGAGGASGTCSIIPDSVNRDLSIMVYKMPDASQLAGAIITDDPWYYASAKMTTRVTTTPANEGEYRSRYKNNTSSNNFVDVAPTTAISATNGFKLDPIAYTQGQTSGLISLYDIFVGKDKTVEVNVYASTGRTGEVFSEYTQSTSTVAQGVRSQYNPSTGVLTVEAGVSEQNTSTRCIGRDSAGNCVTTGYFDVKVFNNPLAAGMKTAENYLQLDGHDGVDTTNSRILRFTSTYVNKGSAFTTATTTAAGTSVTINEDGFYSISFSDRNPASVDSFAITKNATSVTADASNFTSAMGLLAAARSTTDWAVNLAWSGPLKKGDVIRVHTNGNSTSNAIVNSMFAIAKVPSPFEVVGGAGSSGPKVEYVSFGDATEPNACTGSPCTTWRKSSGISSVTRSTTGTYSVNFVSGTFAEAPTCTFTSYAVNNYARSQISTTVSTTSWPILTRDTNSQSNIDSSGYVICVGR